VQRHITIIKMVDNVVNDTTDFPITEDGALIPLGVISESGDTISTTTDGLGHTFIETVAAGYKFVDAFESDANCIPIANELGSAVSNSYILDPGQGDVTICFVNHQLIGQIVVEKVNLGGPAGDSFNAHIDGGSAVPFSQSSPSAPQTVAIGGHTVSEDFAAGYTAMGYTVLGLTNQGVCPTNPAHVDTTYPIDIASADVQVTDGETTTVCFYNKRSTVNIHVTKLEVTAGGAAAGSGWAITVTGCGHTFGPTNTNASGFVDFTNLPLCLTGYTVSENAASKAGFVPVGGTSQVVIASTAGATYNVGFENVSLVPPGCVTGCTPPVVTPTPPTPTPLTPTVVPPTATPTRPVIVPPTATPTTTDVLLGATPPASSTPIAPSTGSGLFGTSSGSTSVLLALFGLFSLSGGLATLAFSHRKTRS
jgi:hypothetical protein